MSLLETFFFDFRANTDPVIDGMQEVERSAHQAALSVDSVGDHLMGFAKNIGVAYLAVQAFQMLRDGIAQSAQEMNLLVEASASTGMEIGEMDAWSKSVTDAGGSAEAFQGTIKGLAADLAMVKAKGTSRKMAFFEELGIDEKKIKNTTEMLPLLADSFSKLSEEEALGFGTKMGIDEKTIMLLRGGREEVELMLDRQRQLGVMSQEDAEKVAQFDNAMDELGQVFKNIWRMLTVKIIPVLTLVSETFTDMFLWMKEHESTLQSFGIAFATVVGVVMVGAIYSYIAAMELAQVLSILAWMQMMAPILAVIAAVIAIGAAFALVLDDIRTWQEGGDSIIGRFLGSWEDMETKVFGVFDSIGEYWDRIIENIVSGIEKAVALWENMKGGASALGDDIMGLVGMGSDQQAAASGSPLNAVPDGGSTSKTTNTAVTVGSVTVNTQATDAAGVADGLGGELQKQMAEAVAGHDDGVMA